MPRPLPRGNGLPPLEAKAPRSILPSDNMPETWLTVPSYNSNIMDPNTGVIGTPWNNLLVFMTSRAAFLSQVNSDVTTLQGQMTTVQGQVSSLTGRMTTAEGNIASLTGRMATAEGHITNLLSRMGTAESHITTLQGDITTINTTLTSLQSQITTINARLAAAGIP